MKKTIPISIAHTLFYIEDDAYETLQNYLNSIRTYFAQYPDSIEIMQDIESRIVEQFTDYGHELHTQDKIVTKIHVDRMIQSMGTMNDFDGQVNSKEKVSSEPVTHKLYRDTDNAQIGGVASGIAAYFNIDTTIVRLIFVLSIFFGGTGILAYIILWLVVPEAKTTSQKLEMRGDPINIETVSNVIKEKVEEVRQRQDNRNSFTKIVQKIMRFVASIVQHIVPFIGGVIGVALLITSIISTVVLISLLLVATIEPYTVLGLLPFSPALPWMFYMTMVIASFVLVLSPIICLGHLGLILLKKQRGNYGVLVSIVVAWMCALIACIVGGIYIQQNYIDQSLRYGEHQITIVRIPEVIIQ